MCNHSPRQKIITTESMTCAQAPPPLRRLPVSIRSAVLFWPEDLYR